MEVGLKTAKKLRGVPFKKGFDERRNLRGRPKGRKNFKTIFYETYQRIADDLNLDKEPDQVQIELIKIGIKRALMGNFSFWKDLMNRIFGKI